MKSTGRDGPVDFLLDHGPFAVFYGCSFLAIKNTDQVKYGIMIEITEG